MSVGGKVIEVIKLRDDKVWVNTLDNKVECGVLCNPGKETIQIGDSLWWQGGTCYWTPKFGTREDVSLKKIGFSGVSKKSALIMEKNGGEMPDDDAG